MIKKITSNWQSGLTVALVSIPLSISLAIASGASPLQGIITALWAGLIASLFGGSHFNITGPTGALSGILSSSVFTHGYEASSMLAIAAGIIILIAYLFKIERYIRFIPPNVINGFTLGVACIIALDQINFACALYNLPRHATFIFNVWESLTHLSQGSLVTLLVFIIFLIILFITGKLFPQLPAVIICSPLGIILGYTTSSWLHLATLDSIYGTVTIKLFQMPSFYMSPHLIWPALTVALIAIIETMLSAKIADTMTHTRHKSHQEMFGLGLANIISGLAGGIPATASLTRTALNIKSGATDKMSATLSSIFIAIIALIFLPYFKFIPMAVIAAILVNLAIHMVEIDHFFYSFAHDKISFAISILVAVIAVSKDPIAGILVGTSISLLLAPKKL